MDEQNSQFEQRLTLFGKQIEDCIKASDVIYVSPHNNMDFDSLASAAAICELCRKYHKRVFIVNDDIPSLMQNNVRKMKDNLSKKYPFINTSILSKIRLSSLPDEEVQSIIKNDQYVVNLCLRMILKEKGLRFFLNYVPQSDMDTIVSTHKNKSDDKLFNILMGYDKLVFETVKEVFKGYEKAQELVIMVDLNKIYLTPMENLLSTFNRVIVIDHHNTDEKTIDTPYKLIDTNVSSASELVFYLLEIHDVQIDSYLAHCLLAGIYLDTNRLLKKNSPEIAIACAKLMRLGADFNEVNRLFMIENYEIERIQTNMINKLIDESIFKRYDIAITMNTEVPETLYEDDSILARAADQLLQYESVAASFVMGFIDHESCGLGHKDKIAIKGRSNNKIDISAIMKALGGGGDSSRGACVIEESNIEKVKAALDYILSQSLTLSDNTTMNKKILQFLPQLNNNNY